MDLQFWTIWAVRAVRENFFGFAKSTYNFGGSFAIFSSIKQRKD